MDERFSRSELLFGKDKMQRLNEAKVAIFGVGGVGGYAVEALCRSGVGRLDLFDDDKICLSNFNRQIYATQETIGRYKVDVAKERILDINPNAVVGAFKLFYLPETSDQVDLSQYDYVIDAIDTASGKIELAVKASKGGIPIISSMGAGNKLRITDFEVADIYSTSVCPLAKVMRRELSRRGVEKLKVVYSKELPIPPAEDALEVCIDSGTCPDDGLDDGAHTRRSNSRRRQTPGSTSFVPPAVGLIIAAEVVRDLTK